MLTYLAMAYHATLSPSTMDNYSLLADAWLHGHAWIAYPGEAVDAVPYHGRAYVIEPPFPAVVLLPFAIFARGPVNQSLPCALIFAIGCGTIVWIARDLGFARVERLIFAVFFALCTSLFFCAWHGHVWYFAHVCAVTLTFLMVALLMRNAKPQYVFAAALCAGLSRFTLLPLLVPYALYMYATRDRIAWKHITLAAAGVVLPIAALLIFYNYARWGVAYDVGYSYFYRRMIDEDGSPFGLAYLPRNLWHIFAIPPRVIPRPPFVAPYESGPGILLTAWPLGAALYARRPGQLVTLLWAAAAIVLVPNLFYFSYGDVHFGARHALDFAPFLLVLAMLALRPRAPRWLLAGMLATSAACLWLLVRFEAIHG